MIASRADRPQAITLGGDKGFDAADFVMELREINVTTRASLPCAPGQTFAAAAVMAFPSPSSPGRVSTREISVLDAVGLLQRTRAAFSAISSSTMATI